MFTRRVPTQRESGGKERLILARGQKTVLRVFDRSDVDRWIAWPRHTDPMFEGYNPPHLTTRQRDLYYQQRYNAPDGRQYGVDDLEEELVGRISLREMDWRLGSSVLGISLHPGKLNQGLGTDSLITFLGYYFDKLQMSSLFLDVAAFNYRAYRVYEKCGFRRCGQRWGEPQTDVAGVFRKPEYEAIRHLFRWEYGLLRPLLIDMVIRRAEWNQQRSTG